MRRPTAAHLRRERLLCEAVATVYQLALLESSTGSEYQARLVEYLHRGLRAECVAFAWRFHGALRKPLEEWLPAVRRRDEVIFGGAR